MNALQGAAGILPAIRSLNPSGGTPEAPSQGAAGILPAIRLLNPSGGTPEAP